MIRDPEVRVQMDVVDGGVRVHVDKINRSDKTCWELGPDGMWQSAALYKRRPRAGFTISKHTLIEVLSQVTEEP